MPTPRVGPLGILSATGSMLYRDASGDVDSVNPGNNGQLLTLVGGLPVWQDASLSAVAFDYWTPSDALFGAINSQTGIARMGVRNRRTELLFTDTAAAPADNENAVFMGVVIPDYDAANSLALRIDWAAPAAVVVGSVKWNAAFERMALGVDDIDVDDFAAIQTVTTVAPGTTGFLVRTTIPFTTAQADSIAAGEDYRLQIVRDAEDAADTLVGDATVLRVSLAEV